MSKVKCCNCDWVGDDETLSLFETNGDGTDTVISEETSSGMITRLSSEKPKESFFFKGCPNCKTDDYLMDLD